MNSDPRLHERLRAAADPLPFVPERALTSLDASVKARRLRRRAETFLVVALVAGLGGYLAVQVLPGRSDVPATPAEPLGSIAYTQATESGFHIFQLPIGAEPVVLLGEVRSAIPRWSPDATTFGYLYEVEGDMGLGVSPGDSLIEDGDVRDFSWSPGGARIGAVVHLPDVDGDEIRVVDVATGASRTIVDGGSWYGVDWSPDGSRLVVAGQADVGPDNVIDSGLYLVNPDGSSLSLLDDRPETFDFFPRWSPDGTQIAFGRSRGYDDVDTQMDVFIVDPATGDLTQLTDRGGFDGFPAWSPDGSWIAFASDRGPAAADAADAASGSAIVAIRPDGSGLHELLPQIDGEFLIPSDWRS